MSALELACLNALINPPPPPSTAQSTRPATNRSVWRCVRLIADGAEGPHGGVGHEGWGPSSLLAGQLTTTTPPCRFLSREEDCIIRLERLQAPPLLRPSTTVRTHIHHTAHTKQDTHTFITPHTRNRGHTHTHSPHRPHETGRVGQEHVIAYLCAGSCRARRTASSAWSACRRRRARR